MSMDDSKPVPKKRGRKPKNHIDNTNIILSSNTPIQTPLAVNDETKAIHKKRGRIPKGGKIVEPELSQKGDEEPKMNFILSLTCSLKDLQSSTQIDYLEPYNSNMNGGFEPLNNEMDNNSINNLGCNYSVMDEQSPVKDKQPNILPEVENDETETKAIWKKLKQLNKILIIIIQIISNPIVLVHVHLIILLITYLNVTLRILIMFTVVFVVQNVVLDF